MDTSSQALYSGKHFHKPTSFGPLISLCALLRSEIVNVYWHYSYNACQLSWHPFK